MSALLGVPVDAAYHAVSFLSHLLTPALGGLAAAAAIILFTMAIRLLVLPLSFRAARGLEAQTRVAPKVKALREKYAQQPDRMRRELTALYRAEGTSMFAGFGPLLLQWPLLSVIYLLFRSPVISGQHNALLSHDLFGAALGSHWLGGSGPLSTQGIVFAAVFAVIAAASLLTTHLARRRAAVGPAPATPANRARRRAAVGPAPATPASITTSRANRRAVAGPAPATLASIATPASRTSRRAAAGPAPAALASIATPASRASRHAAVGSAPAIPASPAPAIPVSPAPAIRASTPSRARRRATVGSALTGTASTSGPSVWAAARSRTPNPAQPTAGPVQPGALARTLSWVTPFISVVIAAFVPLAAGLYLVTTALWTLGERILLQRRTSPRTPANP